MERIKHQNISKYGNAIVFSDILIFFILKNTTIKKKYLSYNLGSVHVHVNGLNCTAQ
jgi:hypothetical protein